MKKIFLTLIIINFAILSTYAEDEQALFYSVSRTCRIDESYSSIVGYKVVFPEILLKKYKKESVSVGLGLSNKATKQESLNIKDEMLEAIDNNETFKKLSQFKPYRETGAFYSSDGTTLVVATMPEENYSKVEGIDNEDGNTNKDNNDIVYRDVRLHWKISDSENGKIGILSWKADKIEFIIFYLDKMIEKEEAQKIAMELIG